MGGGGGCSSLFVVVGTQHVFVVLIYRLQALNLPWLFLSQCDVAANGWGRGDVEGANRQPPVGGQRWWCCVSGVGGNRRGGVAYLSAIKQNNDVVVVIVPRQSVLHGCNVAQLTHGVICGSGAVECIFHGRWSSPWLSSLLGGHGHWLGSCHGGSHLLGGCHCLAAGVVL